MGQAMLDDDGMPLEEVGTWAKEKHERLRKYVDISRAVRRKFVPGGGATYIDLYCGSGRAIIRNTDEKIDGSPLVAFKCARDGGVPFSEIHIADASEESCRAAEQRLVKAGGSPEIEIGNAEDTVVHISKKLNPYGLHFAFLDPYNLEDLPFSVIEALCKFKHMDILIHVSAQDLQRNLDAYSVTDDSPLDRFAPGWKRQINLKQTQRAIRAALVDYWASKIEKLGLPPAEHAELVSGPSRNQRLYWLIFVSRHELAKEFWDKIRSLSGQRDLFGGAWDMAGSSEIEWTEATWNPIAGCNIISPGCTNCYAMRMASRLQAMGMAKYAGTTRKSGRRHVWTGKVNVDPNALSAPLAWKKPQRIFVNSMSDLFQEKANEKFILQVWRVMQRAHWHSFQILTKRPERMLDILSRPEFPTLANVWLGTSVESHDYLDRVNLLRRVPAHVRFVSFEPLLGPIVDPDLTDIHWAIVGGESGPRARPIEAWWVEELRDACKHQSVAFFFKQWGGKRKKKTGRLLAGRLWDEYPTIAESQCDA